MQHPLGSHAHGRVVHLCKGDSHLHARKQHKLVLSNVVRAVVQEAETKRIIINSLLVWGLHMGDEAWYMTHASRWQMT